jgi:hypothetical protein
MGYTIALFLGSVLCSAIPVLFIMEITEISIDGSGDVPIIGRVILTLIMILLYGHLWTFPVCL